MADDNSILRNLLVLLLQVGVVQNGAGENFRRNGFYRWLLPFTEFESEQAYVVGLSFDCHRKPKQIWFSKDCFQFHVIPFM